MLQENDIDVPIYSFPNTSTEESSVHSTPSIIAEPPPALLPSVRKRGRPKSNYISQQKTNPLDRLGYLSDSSAFSSINGRKVSSNLSKIVAETGNICEQNRATVVSAGTVVKRRRRKSIKNAFSKLSTVNRGNSNILKGTNLLNFGENKSVNRRKSKVTINNVGLVKHSESEEKLENSMHLSNNYALTPSKINVNITHSGSNTTYSMPPPVVDFLGVNNNGRITNNISNHSSLMVNRDDSQSHSQSNSTNFEENLIRRLLPQTEAAITAGRAAGLSGPHNWTTEMVAAFIATLPGCGHLAEAFAENEIDGPALLCMDQFDLLSSLRLKLGPTVKVLGAIRTFRRTMMSLTPSDLAEDHAAALTSMRSYFTPASLMSEKWNNSTNGFKTVNLTKEITPSMYESKLCVNQAHPDSCLSLVNGV